jgi:ABC-type hemin transport system substrate-binding protein
MSNRPAIVLVAVTAALCLAVVLKTGGQRPAAGPRPPAGLSATAQSTPDPAASRMTDHLRVVALTPGLTETLRRMDLGAAVVGRHGFDAWTPSTVPVCGDQAGLDAEILLRVRPTHLYVQWGQRELPPTIGDLAAREKWTVRNFDLLSLAQIGSAAEQLYGDARSALPAELRPPALQAERFADAEVGKAWNTATTPRSGAARASVAALGPVLTLYNDREPAAAAGPGSYHYEILTLLGATQAVTTGSAYQTLDRETMRRLNPAVLIVLKPRKLGATETAPPPSTESLRTSLGLDPASTTHIILIDDPLAFVPGLNLVDLISTVERALKALPPR